VPKSEHPPDARLEPLTRCNREGVPYRRDASVEQQILSALSLPTDDLLSRAQITDKSDAHYLQEEALAYLVRRAYRVRDDLLVNGLSDILAQRSTRYLKSVLRNLRPDPLEDAVAEAMADLAERLFELEGNDRGDFLQVRFWVVVKRFAKTAFKQARRDSDEELLAIDPTGAGPDDDAVKDFVQVEDRMATALDTQLLTDEALALLEPNMREAFLLRADGWPIEDQDPTVPTISRHFGKTSRTIRYWLAEADKRLAAWQREEKTS
jgi:hypothetical protein